MKLAEVKRKLDELIDRAVFDIDPTSTLAKDTVRNFKSGGEALLEAATPHMWEYYRRIASRRGLPFDEATDIWEHASFANPPTIAAGDGVLEPAPAYVSFEGEVDWEPEHGLQLVFESGLRVCKVGPYDGHFTHAHGYGDPKLLGIVYYAVR